jgi:hypothetical protein
LSTSSDFRPFSHVTSPFLFPIPPFALLPRPFRHIITY